MADGDRSSGAGSTAFVAIVAILALLAVGYFLFGRGMLSDTKKVDADVTITTPSASATQ